MTKVIDIHMHLGDIFHDNKNITFKTNIKKGDYPDPFLEIEESGYTKPIVVENAEDMQRLIDSGQFRSWEATLENCAAEMDKYGYTYCVALPIWPNTTFEEYLAASKLDARIIAFTTPDFSLPVPEMQAKLKKDLKRGARGVKLHPIIQNIPLYDERMLAAAEAVGEEGWPICTHVGCTPYYGESSPWVGHHCPAYGALPDFYNFCRQLPNDYIIIGAHRNNTIEDFAENVGDMPNVMTDTSMCNAGMMRKGVEMIGPDRLMFGTDYPFGTLGNSLAELKKAFADEPQVLEKVAYGNAARILKL